LELIKVYKYKVLPQRRERLQLNRVTRIKAEADEIPLTGWVHGKRATDIEERFARALMGIGLDFRFQVPVKTRVSLPGHERVVDFIVETGLTIPVEVDGPRGHNNSAQQAMDEVREMLLNEVFRWWGYSPLQRVPWWRLDTQEGAGTLVREIFS
jgi:hypothetical protein